MVVGELGARELGVLQRKKKKKKKKKKATLGVTEKIKGLDAKRIMLPNWYGLKERRKKK